MLLDKDIFSYEVVELGTKLVERWRYSFGREGVSIPREIGLIWSIDDVVPFVLSLRSSCWHEAGVIERTFLKIQYDWARKEITTLKYFNVPTYVLTSFNRPGSAGCRLCSRLISLQNGGTRKG